MTVFLDTNVLISAFMWGGVPGEVYDRVLLRHDLVIGAVNLDEVERVLREKLGVSEEDLALLLSKLRKDAHVEPRPARPAPHPEHDVADAWVLASALAAEADVLVTGDRDLLDLAGQVAALRILSPKSFLDA
jgi:putative PIN family toxin of toxin-antitoxin system